MRRGEPVPEDKPSGQDFLMPLANEISKISTSLRQARFVAGEEARMRLEKLDSPWTAERLKEFMKAYLKNRPVFQVRFHEFFKAFSGPWRIKLFQPHARLLSGNES